MIIHVMKKNEAEEENRILEERGTAIFNKLNGKTLLDM